MIQKSSSLEAFNKKPVPIAKKKVNNHSVAQLPPKSKNSIRKFIKDK